jgi:hypothetical protein
LHIYLETSNRAWYYISYRKGDIEVYSSNETFNIAISSKSAKTRVKLAAPEDISLFLEDFSHKYHGGEYINEVDAPGDKKDKDKKKEEIEKKDGF